MLDPASSSVFTQKQKCNNKKYFLFRPRLWQGGSTAWRMLCCYLVFEYQYVRIGMGMANNIVEVESRMRGEQACDEGQVGEW